MTPAQQQLVATLTARFGERIALTDPKDIAPWLTDWRGRWTGQSAAILQPATTEEVAVAVREAAALGVPLVPQGGNTSMVGGATPPEDGSALIMSLRRMNRIRGIDPDAMSAVAEAGVVLQTLQEAVAEQGMRFPLTLGARGSATVGGLTSTNAGGTQVLRFGPMRGLVQGIEAVLPDGSVHDGLAGLKKDNRGPSLDQLLVGAEGTMGIVTAVRLSLVPAVHSRAVAWLGLDDLEAALEILGTLRAHYNGIEGFEVLPDESLQAAIRQIPNVRSPLAGRHRWHALVEAVAQTAADEMPAAALTRGLGPLLERGTIADAVIASNEAQARDFWRIRDSLSEAEKKEYGPATQHDISVPVASMPSFLTEAARTIEATFPGTHASGFGHLGDGNIHFHVRSPDRDDGEWLAREGDRVTRLVHDLVVAAGGSISAEHGIGQMKRAELARLSPERVSVLRALKAGLDPKGLMNPGKLV